MIDDAELTTQREPIDAAARSVAEEPRRPRSVAEAAARSVAEEPGRPRSSPTPASGGWSTAVVGW